MGAVTPSVTEPEMVVATDLERSRRHWDQLHAQPRFRPRAPNEGVVRFLMRHYPEDSRKGLRALDIGVGGGRHTRLLSDLGFQAAGIDLSVEGLRHTGSWLGGGAALAQASMMELPFRDQSFDAAVSFGVYYYADRAGMGRSIVELHRILRPGGRAFVVLRTVNDYRFGKGAGLEPHTFRLEIVDTNEYGAVMHFLPEEEVAPMFRGFSQVSFERSETSFRERTAVNSDWLVELCR